MLTRKQFVKKLQMCTGPGAYVGCNNTHVPIRDKRLLKQLYDAAVKNGFTEFSISESTNYTYDLNTDQFTIKR